MPELPENIDPVEAVETQRESGGQAPIAGVGEVEGEGDSRRKEGRSETSRVSAIFGGMVALPTEYVAF